MRAVILKTRPGSQFHFGKISPDDKTGLNETSDFAHSDTLFSALVNIIAESFPEQVEGFIGAVRDGRLRFSSVFYCLQNGDLLRYFLPSPANWSLKDPDTNNPFSRISFLSKKVWEQGITPKKLAQDGVLARQFAVIQNQFLVHQSELSPSERGVVRQIRLFHKTTIPKVSIKPNLDEDNDLFSRTMVQTADNTDILDEWKHPVTPDLQVHFYFLEKTEDPFLLEDIYQVYQTALQILINTGLGGERSTGCGQFEGLDFHNFSFDETNSNSARYVSLALFSPWDAKELGKLKFYSTQLRGGRLTYEDGSLKLIRMVSEGAVATGVLNGNLVNLSQTPNPFLRCGAGIWVKAPF